MTEYDITAAFKAIEDELIASMIRNMKRHRAEETKEGIEWSMWQAEQLKALEKYKRDNQKKYKKQFKDINGQITALLQQARAEGNMQQEIRILQAIKKGWKVHGRNKSPAHQAMTAEFFKLNERKLEALIEATMHDMQQAETAVLRMANDQYRKTIFNAQVYANTGAGTYEKAVDMATKDFLAAGLNCIVYANGARHTLSDYADMAIRTASKRAYLQGEGEKRQEWGIATVIVNKRGNPCPKCLPFCGKVLIDDVWSGGEAYINGKQRNKTPTMGLDKNTGKIYPLMSKAIEHGLYHPRCKDSHTTYFEGISTADDSWTQEELEKVGQNYQLDQKQQYAARQAEKFDRMAKYSLDEENKKQNKAKAETWKAVESKAKTDIIELSDSEKHALNQYVSFDFYVINEKLRNGLELAPSEKLMVSNLDDALKKMPKYEGDLSRSLYFGDEEAVKEFLERMKIGEDICFDEFISTTCDSELYNPDGEIQIFIQNSVKGRDIRSVNNNEMEILYERNSKFKVLNIVQQNEKYWILLEEE